MSLEIKCAKCGNEMDTPGALAFSPPDFPWGLVEKLHLCVPCWRVVRAEIMPRRESAAARVFPQPHEGRL